MGEHDSHCVYGASGHNPAWRGVPRNFKQATHRDPCGRRAAKGQNAAAREDRSSAAMEVVEAGICRLRSPRTPPRKKNWNGRFWSETVIVGIEPLLKAGLGCRP